VKRNHRLIIYASDYEEFTFNSLVSLDARSIQNTWFEGMETCVQ